MPPDSSQASWLESLNYRYILLLAHELEAQGFSADGIYQLLKLSAEQLAEIDSLSLDESLYLALDNYVLQQTHNNGFGLSIGSKMRLDFYGVLGHAMSCCSTMDEALNLGLNQYNDIINAQLNIQFISKGELSFVTLANQHYPDDLFQLYLDITLASIAGLIENLHPDNLVPMRICLAEKLTDKNRSVYYQSFFGCEVQFNASQNGLVYQQADLQKALPADNPVMLNIYKGLCDQQRQNRDSEQNILKQVKDILSESVAVNLLGGYDALISEHEVADKLAMHPRTLRRKLQQYDCSFRDLYNDIRCQQAKLLLNDKHKSIDQISEQLGFNDSSSFRKAFKNWTGLSPSQFRNNLKR